MRAFAPPLVLSAHARAHSQPLLARVARSPQPPCSHSARPQIYELEQSLAQLPSDAAAQELLRTRM